MTKDQVETLLREIHFPQRESAVDAVTRSVLLIDVAYTNLDAVRIGKIYARVGAECGESAAAVDFRIRYGITTLLQMHGVGPLERIGFRPTPERNRPTNKEFLLGIVRTLRGYVNPTNHTP